MLEFTGIFQQQDVPSGIVVPSGLIWYAPTNEGTGATVTDVISGNNATLSGSYSWAAGPKGVSGTAIQMTADSAIAKVPTANAPKPASAVSICCWWYKTTDVAWQCPMIMPVPSDASPFMSYAFIQGATNTIRFQGNANAVSRASANSSISMNVWTFLTGTHALDGGFALYTNATLRSTSATATGDILYYGTDLCLGNTSEILTRWARGPVAHFRVYNRALTGTEITEIYDAEKP